MRLSGLDVPFLCLVVSEPTVKGCLKVVDRFEPVADSFEINLPPLEPSQMGDVFHSTLRPCIATSRRSDFMKVYGYSNLPRVSDRSRAEALKRAVGLGAAAVDFELDLFQPPASDQAGPEGADNRVSGSSRPRLVEFSTDPEVVKSQTTLASEIRAAGAEVVMSCHTKSVLHEEQALEIVHGVAGRGGQFAKVVSVTPRREDVFEMLACAFSLNRKALMPFTLMNIGADSPSDRLLSVLAGSTWLYCRPPSKHSYAGQPTFEDARAFVESLGLREL